MDFDFISGQLEKFAESLSEIAEILSAHAKDENHLDLEDLNNILIARWGIMDSILSLNLLHNQTQESTPRSDPHSFSCEDKDNKLCCKGRIVLAPRYTYSLKRLCMDFAIILSYDTADTSQSTLLSGLEDKKVYIAWLRPLSKFELFASPSSISFSNAQIQYSSAESLKLTSTMLRSIRLGDRIICRSQHGPGYYEQGLVISLDITDQTVVTVKIFPSIGETRIENFICNISSISPIPGDGDGKVDDENNWKHRLNGNRTENPTNVTSINHSISSSSSSSMLPYEKDGRSYHHDHHQDNHNLSSLTNSEIDSSDIRSFNYAKIQRSTEDSQMKSSLSSDNILRELNRFGTWERYTKGIGTKVLRKFGYARGRGLGKNQQGLLVPVQGLLKALPTGLSLDYIGQEIANQSIPEDVKSKPKSSIPENKPSVFDFLNSIQQENNSTDNVSTSASITSTSVKMMPRVSSVKQKVSQGTKNVF